MTYNHPYFHVSREQMETGRFFPKVEAAESIQDHVNPSEPTESEEGGKKKEKKKKEKVGFRDRKVIF